ncbi:MULTISPECIES: histidinol-phosphatase [Chromohalobacter]|uniref:Histidinol-phosphatase n=1 Tax=Chromohalobacter israelensis (strain ATCC BAA-138 / DSM 3043 / CIP 106854 / NCIMB 13768 / 1H11) TaxID=290398 RepID=Q1QUD3_CHRI1|nr:MULTISPECIES: HAD family hydrolase [Chromohalobacter]ABE59925.1 HAD-superfamily subfamily IB, PSPase-like protein [Chromohalobacter salexigens DSM 3043]MDF9435967.1 HAD-IB family hydrolase [Chromohalobacter israelensis]MDO0947421.1 HAD family hydrolase [Chromohalobacter salexigens]NQY46654.1 HAD family hydrolase [Chromohalobacter sp.]NWO57918.1 HAD-IB family hydrolase [Chromohalobacter salexigens]
MSLAIFDLDNTLLDLDSDHAWGEFLIEQGAVDATTYRDANERFYQQYQDGTLDIMAYLALALKPLAENTPEQLAAWHQQFMASKIEPHILTRGEELLARHRAKGDRLLIITATNRFITGPIAERLGVDDLIAVEPEIEAGHYTGRVVGTPSFREGKVERLDAWLAEEDVTLDGAWFYSDSHNDLPLLERVDHPVAVDPDDALREAATQRGWRILSLRD